MTARRADGKSASITWFFTVGATKYQHYFGQLHSHTQYSDGSGTLDSALSYIRSLPVSANVQFVGQLDKESDDAILGGNTDVAGATTTDGQPAGQ